MRRGGDPDDDDDNVEAEAVSLAATVAPVPGLWERENADLPAGATNLGCRAEILHTRSCGEALYRCPTEEAPASLSSLSLSLSLSHAFSLSHARTLSLFALSVPVSRPLRPGVSSLTAG